MGEPNEARVRTGSRQVGIAQACTVCYQRKIKCDLSTGKTPCTNCSLYNSECLPRLRKRKRTISSVLDDHSREEGSLQRQKVGSARDLTSPSPGPSFITRRVQIEGARPHRIVSPSQPRDTEVNLDYSLEASRRVSDEGHDPRNEDDDADSNGEVPKVMPTAAAHDGKALYFGHLEGRIVEATKAYPQTTTLLSTELTTLQQSGAFDFPPRALKACFIDNFFKYCYSWVPVVEASWLLETPRQKPSALLVQAVLLAGSRVTAPNDISVSRDIYQRAKTLFFSNYEQNPVRRVIVCLLLRWWCPAGPDRVCIDSSHFWIGTGVRIAISIGLNTESTDSRDASYRRRLWWSLIAHDSQLSAVHGWPGMIHEEDHNVSPPQALDFSRNASSLAFITISRILGDVGHSYRRKQMAAVRIEKLQNALYVWIRELPEELRLYHAKPTRGLKAYHFEGRQLHVIYFVNVILPFRQDTIINVESLTAESVVAASFVAGIYEEFLVRDEMCHLGLAIHKFFLLAAGMTLLQSRRIPALVGAATEDYEIIMKALEQFSKRYPSTKGTIRTLQNMEASQTNKPDIEVTISQPERNIPSLFRELGPELCRHWQLMDDKSQVFRDPSAAARPLPSGPADHESATTVPPRFATDQDGPDEFYSADNSLEAPILDLDSLWTDCWPAMPDPTDWILDCMPLDLSEPSALT
ncbi:hypothetical protein CC79DRAFT_1312635 [Sarocladium strictum]